MGAEERRVKDELASSKRELNIAEQRLAQAVKVHEAAVLRVENARKNASQLARQIESEIAEDLLREAA
jgi:hypothetical protein